MSIILKHLFNAENVTFLVKYFFFCNRQKKNTLFIIYMIRLIMMGLKKVVNVTLLYY